MSMTRFDRDFRSLVAPRLERLIRAYAYHVQLGVDGYNDAYQAVMDYARKYGAIHLSEPAFDDLIEWIQLELLTHIDDLPPADVLTPEQVIRMGK